MFFLRYLGRELRSRARQAVLIALGLAVGVGLVITVDGAANGVGAAQGGVLKGLYGVGTDVTVTKPPPPFNPSSSGGMRVSAGPNGAQVCNGGTCSSGGQTVDNLTTPANAPIAASAVSRIAGLHDVAEAAGGLNLQESQVTIPASLSQGGMPQPKSFTVTGVDSAHADLGPLSEGTISAGRGFRAADGAADVTIADSGYAAANGLSVGSTVTIAKTAFTVIGVATQPQGSNPPDLYIPLPRAQALGTDGDGGPALTGDVNIVYVAAAGSADISSVQHEISRLLPSDTVTTPSSLANTVSESLSSAAQLAGDLGTWLSVLVLVAAFSVAALLTVAAVTRRVREFGTLRALGWPARRITAQVMGESVVIGIVGAALGVGLGFAGAAVVTAVAPNLTASQVVPTGQHFETLGAGGAQTSNPTVTHMVSVPLAASVSGGAVLLAVGLALLGGLLAGAAGSWRTTRLRPADALTRVG
ncbi:MAG TPA: FtsX-like permease family protein [Actinocrinis sp.]